MNTEGEMADPHTLPEIAFYYPNPIWRYGDWIKNLILFFDGVGLLVPEYMKERPEQADPAIVVVPQAAWSALHHGA